MKRINVALLGATGAVGEEFLNILVERNFPYANLKLLASPRSAGKKMVVGGKECIVEAVTPDSFNDVDLAFFSAGGSVSLEYAPHAVRAGAVVIDNTSAYRMEPNVPLVVPEVNPEDIRRHKGIIANPNCSTIIMVTALKPLYDAARIKRIVVSTYQAVSGAGAKGMEELKDQVKAYVAGEEITARYLPSAGAEKHYQIAFNLLPQIDSFSDMGYTKEEWKMVKETQKMLHDPEIRITATTIRVPVFRSHSESINIEQERKVTADEARAILRKAPGIVVQDDPTRQEYPMPLFTADTDPVYVGRIREDNSCENGLNLWVVGDQIRKGAALNSIQIAEYMLANQLL
ncbi:MAG TPA: aspartate-semialdehyde dehydrogenase [Firmicutes bacterium]|jgi:aspartate-semialdehyde dehydrogenase|nr:aspartate-semialdehyde dehydrogenase [Bacillota bacterium]